MRRTLAALAGSVLIGVLAACGSTVTTSPTGATSAATTVPAPAATSSAPADWRPSAPANPTTYPEQVDVHSGILVYNSNNGSAVNGANLPYASWVAVICKVPNQTGMTSFDPSFYRYLGADGRFYYVSSAQFANGDALGDPSGSHRVDAKVPACA